MIPGQTLQVLLGAATAFVYAAAIMAIGNSLLTLIVGHRRITDIVRARVGFFGVLCLGFVIGQGILGTVWMSLSLVGRLYAGIVWIVCILGWFLVGGGLLALLRRKTPFGPLRFASLTLRHGQSWYFYTGIGIAIVTLLYGAMAVLPPVIDDALKHYLVWSKMIAVTHKIELQPALHPYYGLLPMQIEMHWAALFAISNETAVTVWDYFCAVNFLGGIGFLAWSLTSSRRVACIAVLTMLSTPAFYAMMGGGKVDNASAQFGIAAALWLVLWPALGRRAAILAGLCVGWAMASRYTNVILLPGLIFFALMVARRNWKAFPVDITTLRSTRYWATETIIAGVAAGIVAAPMLLKNWLLVGCPLAPELGCQATSWARIYQLHTSNLHNLSILDVFFYPLVLTFASRDSMLGNVSPLFIGFCPFLLVYRRSSLVRSAWVAGWAGLASMLTWLLIEPLVLFTRFLLVPLALLAVPLSASLVVAEQDLRRQSGARQLIRGAVSLVFLFLLFESRSVIHAGRYLASTETRADRYESWGGYDVASWLNAHVQPGERVALGNYKGHRYFVDSNVLLNAESTEEFQWLWEHGQWLYGGSGSVTPSSWISDFWLFYTARGFTYIVVAKDHVRDALSAWPSTVVGARLRVVAVGRANDVLKIDKL